MISHRLVDRARFCGVSQLTRYFLPHDVYVRLASLLLAKHAPDMQNAICTRGYVQPGSGQNLGLVYQRVLTNKAWTTGKPHAAVVREASGIRRMVRRDLSGLSPQLRLP